VPRFESFDLVAKVSGAIRRVAKVKFARDGSIYVFFPGFAKTDGIICRAILRGGKNAQTSLDLTKNGRVTSHLVKYTHHPDGEAHFSQDGKVRTEVRRKSESLVDHRGHLFTIQAQNVGSFPILPARKAQLTLELPDNVRTLKITGWRYHFSDLELPEGITPTGVPKGIQLPDSALRDGLFVAPPEGARFDDIVLFIAAEEIPWFSQDKAPCLIFLGGFDPPQTVLNRSVDTEFLTFAYPCSDYEQLRKRIGAIDLFPPERRIANG
jgi:hypothetical protein